MPLNLKHPTNLRFLECKNAKKYLKTACGYRTQSESKRSPSE